MSDALMDSALSLRDRVMPGRQGFKSKGGVEPDEGYAIMFSVAARVLHARITFG
jgi:hypothetical protein